MPKYPIYLEMSERRAVVIGGGFVAVRKMQALHEAGARVTVIAERIAPALEAAFQIPNVEVVISSYKKDYLTGSTLAIAATNDKILNKQIYADCQELEVLCNIVDQPALCDFYVPAVVKRGDLHIAVCTDGHCPAYAGHIRRKLEELFTKTHGQFVDELEKVRLEVLSQVPNANQRKALLGKLASDESFDFFTTHGPEQWHQHAKQMMQAIGP